jgi:hypothetical protein
VAEGGAQSLAPVLVARTKCKSTGSSSANFAATTLQCSHVFEQKTTQLDDTGHDRNRSDSLATSSMENLKGRDGNKLRRTAPST